VKIGVCLKQVPSTDTQIKVNGAGNGIVTDGVKWETNPYDEYALQAALDLKKAGKATEVVILTIGGADAESRIRDGLARGADRALRLDDAAFAGSDALGRARILAAAVRAEGIGTVFAGRQAIDTDNGATPAMLAEVLGWAQVSWIDKLTVDGGTFTAQRAAGGGFKEVVTGALPAVFTCDKGLNSPVAATLMGIAAAKKKAIDVKGAADLGVDPSSVGTAGALVAEDGMAPPPPRPAGRRIEGDAATAARELVQLLRNEAKVI
jgi:electron transfer flavoprotein beta subunit